MSGSFNLSHTLATGLLLPELLYLAYVFLDGAHGDVAIDRRLHMDVLEELYLLFHHHELEGLVIDKQVPLSCFLRFFLEVLRVGAEDFVHLDVAVEGFEALRRQR